MSSPGHHEGAAMQESVLPRYLPVVARLDIAATFVLAPDAGGAAGDWLDAVPTSEGHIALVVGDVAGRGMDAVATMAQLRAMLREQLRRGAGPVEALEATDALATDLAGPAAASICVAVLDPSRGSLCYATAGHPPPLLVGLDGVARYLAGTPTGPLATGGGFRTVERMLRPGELLLLYTDGAFRRHRGSAQEGLDGLAAVVASEFAGLGGGHGIRGLVDRLCDRVLEELAKSGDWVGDDVALLAAELMPPQRRLSVRLTADARAPAAARGELTAWLGELGVREIDRIAAVHAVSEVVSNAAQHAYVDRSPPVAEAIVMTAALRGAGEVLVTVADRGRWRANGAAGPGRGLGLARSLSEELRIDRGAGGTTVTSRHAVARGVGMKRNTDPAGDWSAAATTTFAHGGRVSVRGVIDAASTDELREDLIRFSRGGTESMVIDLTDVSFLDSSGIRLLYEVRAWAHDDVTFEMVASTGCRAEQVLQTAGLI